VMRNRLWIRGGRLAGARCAPAGGPSHVRLAAVRERSTAASASGRDRPNTKTANDRPNMRRIQTRFRLGGPLRERPKID